MDAMRDLLRLLFITHITLPCPPPEGERGISQRDAAETRSATRRDELIGRVRKLPELLGVAVLNFCSEKFELGSRSWQARVLRKIWLPILELPQLSAIPLDPASHVPMLVATIARPSPCPLPEGERALATI